MASGKLIAGIELFSQGARLVLLSPKPVPTVVRCEELLYQAGEEGRVGSLIAKALADAQIPRADVHLVFTPPYPAPGRHHLFVAPKMKKAEVQQVATRELKREASLDVDKMYFTVDTLDTADVIEGDAKSGGTWYMITALQREPVDMVAGGMLGAKLVVRSASTSMIGILRALALQELPKQGCVAVVHLDPKRSALMVLDNGTPRFFRDIPTTFARGGREGGGDDQLIAQAVAREIDISLVFFAQQHRPKHVDTIMFVGDTEIADRVIEWLGEGQGYNILRFGPSAQLAVGPNAPPSLLPYAPAIGAALSARKDRFNSDVLPSEMRGRPERAIVAVLASVVLVALMGFVAQSYRSAARRADEQLKRIQDRMTEYQSIEKRVEMMKKIDEAYARADQWDAFFEGLSLYHRRLGNLLYGLPTTLPPKGTYTSVGLKDAPSPRPPPLPGKQDANLTMTVDGQVLAPDLQAAQSDVLAVHQKIEQTKTVQGANLSPLTQPRPSPEGLHLPFTVTAQVANGFPVKR